MEGSFKNGYPDEVFVPLLFLFLLDISFIDHLMSLVCEWMSALCWFSYLDQAEDVVLQFLHFMSFAGTLLACRHFLEFTG